MPNVGTTRFPRCMARNDAARGGTTPLRNVASLAGHRRQKNRTANVQRDSNSDHFGNLCDSDLNGDLVVNFGDLSMLKAAFFTSDADADFNSDGIVSFADLGDHERVLLPATGTHPPFAVYGEELARGYVSCDRRAFDL